MYIITDEIISRDFKTKSIPISDKRSRVRRHVSILHAVTCSRLKMRYESGRSGPGTLINTSSKIAQIARSRPIPFDVSRQRYERVGTLLRLSRADTSGYSLSIYVTSTCVYIRAPRRYNRPGIYRRSRYRKRRFGKGEGEGPFREGDSPGRAERANQPESQSNFSNLSNPCRMQNQSRANLARHPTNFQIRPKPRGNPTPRAKLLTHPRCPIRASFFLFFSLSFSYPFSSSSFHGNRTHIYTFDEGIVQVEFASESEDV